MGLTVELFPAGAGCFVAARLGDRLDDLSEPAGVGRSVGFYGKVIQPTPAVRVVRAENSLLRSGPGYTGTESSAAPGVRVIRQVNRSTGDCPQGGPFMPA